MSIFFGSRLKFPSSTPNMPKPNKQDLFPSPGECSKESLYTKRSHCSPHLPIKIRQASKLSAQCWEMSKYVQGLVPLWHIPDDRRETAHTQLSPSLEKQGKFPHPHNPRENFGCQFSQPSLSREEQRGEEVVTSPHLSPNPCWEHSWLDTGIWRHF